MRLPRDLSGTELIKRLEQYGYATTRQSGSQVRLTTSRPTPHHITVPLHSPPRVGTLAAIMASVAAHQRMTREELIKQLVD